MNDVETAKTYLLLRDTHPYCLLIYLCIASYYYSKLLYNNQICYSNYTPVSQ